MWDKFRIDYWLLKKLGTSVNEDEKKMRSVYIVIARYSQKDDLKHLHVEVHKKEFDHVGSC